MRIVAGKHGSRQIKTLKGSTTRPTSDKIRGAIFNKIGPYFDEGRFLDVFGGSGAMGLEALSRGIAHVDVIEKDGKAFAIIKENATAMNEMEHMTILKGDAFHVVQKLREEYDIIFLDPPYGYKQMIPLLTIIGSQNLVAKGGWIIVETDGTTELPETIQGFTCIDVKDYKETKVHYYQ